MGLWPVLLTEVAVIKGIALLLFSLILLTPPSLPPTLYRTCFNDVLYGKDRAFYVYTKQCKDKYIWFTRREYQVNFSKVELHEKTLSANAWVAKDASKRPRPVIGMMAAEFTCETRDGGVFGLVWSFVDDKNFRCVYISPQERCAYVCNEVNGQMLLLKRIPLNNNLGKREFMRIDVYPSSTAIHINWEPVFYSDSLGITPNLSYGFLQGRPRYNRITCIYFGNPGERIPPGE
jgi:hypothetical protein